MHFDRIDGIQGFYLAEEHSGSQRQKVKAVRLKVDSTDSCSLTLQPSDPLTSLRQTGHKPKLTVEKLQLSQDKGETSNCCTIKLPSEKEGPTLSC